MKVDEIVKRLQREEYILEEHHPDYDDGVGYYLMPSGRRIAINQFKKILREEIIEEANDGLFETGTQTWRIACTKSLRAE